MSVQDSKALERIATATEALAGTGAAATSATARLASSAATTNATNVKASAGRITKLTVPNKAAYSVFLVLYDSALNPPVPGTTPIKKKIEIPAGQILIDDYPVGLAFANGIGYAFTLNAADADTTAIAAGDVVQFNLDYV